MDSKSIMKVLNDLVATKTEDINIQRLQTILEPVEDELNSLECDDRDCLWKVSIRFLHVLQRFVTTCLIQKRNTGADDAASEEELINLPDQLVFLQAVDRIRQYTLNLYLPKELRGLTKCELRMMVQLEDAERSRRLKYCLEAFRKLFEFKIIALQSKLENCILEYIAGVFSYHSLQGDFSNMRETELFKGIGLFPVEQVFKSLLIIKGVPNLSVELSKQIHLELLRLTGEPGGFPVLCKTLLASVPSDETPTWKKSEIIAKIVACKGHTKKFYRQVLHDMFQFYEASLLSNEQENLPYVGTCIECMRQIYLLPPAYQELRATIDNYFVGRFDQLAEPPELLSGTILLERSQLVASLYINYMAFSGSSCSSLSSSILIAYLHIFLKLYFMIPSEAEERKYLQTLIVFCLSNREKKELESVLEELLLGNDNHSMKIFHPRIYLKASSGSETYSLQVGPSSEDDEHSVAPTLVEILKASNRNLLIYDVFIVLLKLFERVSSGANQNLLLDAEEQDDSQCKTFFRKYVIIQSLMELVSHKHFHSQLYENPSDVLSFIKSLIVKSVDGVQANESLIEIILSIFQEYLQRLQTRDDVQEILKLLKQFQRSTHCGDQLRAQIDHICTESTPKTDSTELTPFQNAFSLCSDREPYCKVYGTTLMIGLLRGRDPETLTQKHSVLILALNNLRSVESYAFLNSVRLLVALCDALEADTIETLIKEYQCTDNEVDYRLKIGEATVKTVEAIGPIAFKYRDQLINCFLHESKSPVDEFRASSLANLGTVCKILSYQVHTFFYEMFLVIKSVIETDSYLPARRAAILVLSQLIEGIDNLLDYQEYLLSIYRFLKFIAETEKDDVTRLQAAVGLDHLSAKTKDFFNAANTALAAGKLEKEIRIFGIKEQEAEERRRNAQDGGILTKMLD